MSFQVASNKMSSTSMGRLPGSFLPAQWNCIDQPWPATWWHRADVVDAFLLFSLFAYVYVYFFPYSEGVSSAPIIFFLIKYFIWGAVLALLLFRGGSSQVTVGDLPAMACMLGVVVTAIHMLHLPQYADASDIINLGNLVVFVPLVVLLRHGHVQRLFDLLPPIMSLQVILSGIAMAAGMRLWVDNSIVGLFANPNSFALALNLAVFRILSRRRSLSAAEVTQVSLLVIGIVLSRSNSQLMIFVLGMIAMGWATGHRRLALIFGLAVTVPAMLIAAWIFDLIATQVILDTMLRVYDIFTGGNSLAAQVALGESGVSGSVTTRVEIHMFAWHFVQQATFAEVLFGDFGNNRYHLFDSQFLMFAVNYGLISLTIFLWLIYTAFMQSWIKMRLTGELFDIAACMIFVLTFFFSRVLYYYPISVLFLAYIVHVSSQTRVLFFQFARPDSGSGVPRSAVDSPSPLEHG